MNHDPLARFRVSTLTPRTAQGDIPQGNNTYELTKYSAAPFVVTGRDARGFPVEETINIAYSQKWVHPSGTINNVPMRTGAVFTNHHDAIAYENETTVDLLLSGWLPLRCCPYSMEWRSITGTRTLAANPDNIEDCGGDEANGGCVHLKAIIAARAAATMKNYEDDLAAFNAMTPAAANQLLSQMAQAMATAQATAARADEPNEPHAPPRPKKGGQ